MRFKKQKRGPILKLTILENRLDANNVPDFKRQWLKLLASGPAGLIIDVSNLEFIDSTGLGAILKGLKLGDQKTVVVVCGAREPILSMFKLTRMDKIIKLFSSEPEALSYVQKKLIPASSI
jgi:anti-sigma B factor antagonist